MKQIQEFKKKFRNSKEWKEKRALLIKKKKCCEWCKGKECLTPAHNNIEFKVEGYPIFILNSCLKYNMGKTPVHIIDKAIIYFVDWYKNFDNCLLLCRRCHFAQTKGMVICKKCKNKYHPLIFEFCYNCNPRKELTEIEKQIEVLKSNLSFNIIEDEYPSCIICDKEYNFNEDGWGFGLYDKKGSECSVDYCPTCNKLLNKEDLMIKKMNKKQEKAERKDVEINRKIKELQKQREKKLKKKRIEKDFFDFHPICKDKTKNT